MTLDIILIIIAFLASIGSGFFLIPQILNFCKKKGLYDLPNARKIHKNAIPRLGGVSFLPCMLLAFIIAIMVFDNMSGEQHLTVSAWSCAFLISLLLIYVVGFVDDLIGLGATIKFVIQIIAATLLPLSGLCINNLYGLFGIYEIPFFISLPITVFVMVLIMNSINLIDGIDGLCAGLSFLALGGFLISFMREEMYIYSILIAGLMGVLIPYFYFNVYGNADNNRKIFMGDSGSLTLGFILGFLFVKYAMNNPAVMPFRMDGLLLPYTLLIVPVFDVGRIIMTRLRHHKPLFDADKNHIHHKLIRAGLNQHQTLCSILILATAFIIQNHALFLYTDITVIIILDILTYILFHLGLNHIIKTQGKSAFSENK